MKNSSFCWLLLLCFAFPSQAQSLLKSGPMAGYSDFKEVALWVQTNGEAKIQFQYWEKGKPTQKTTTKAVEANPEFDYATTIRVSNLQPGTRYSYQLLLNGKIQTLAHPLEFCTQELWQNRKDPPNFKFALGSCFYVKEAAADRPKSDYGDSTEIMTALAAQKPDFMLWLGDNVYMREPDWNTRSGILHRFGHTRATPPLQELLGVAHQYGIWDDHDYGPNDSDRSFWNKRESEQIFKAFFPNLNYNATGKGGITGTFTWGDCQFFMLDDRYFRAPNNLPDQGKDYFGKEQLEWLLDALVSSKATFKFVLNGGQILNPAALYENYATYSAERTTLLSKIAAYKIPGVFFLSGDRHHTVLSKMDRPGAYPLYDLTCSPLSAGAHLPKDEQNFYALKETLYGNRNFGMMEVSGPLKERVLKISIYNVMGKLVWTKEIKAAELK